MIASPAHPADAAPMLRTCVAHARSTGAVCVFLEPIALYHDPDLHEPATAGGRHRRSRPPPTSVAPRRTARPATNHATSRSSRGRTALPQPAGTAPPRGRARDPRPRGRSPLDRSAPGRRHARERRARRAGCSSSTRRGASGGVGEGIIAALVERRCRGTHRPRRRSRFVRPTRRRCEPRPRQRGRHRRRCADLATRLRRCRSENGESPGDDPGLQRKE